MLKDGGLTQAAAVEDLLLLIWGDPQFREAIDTSGADRDDLKGLYERLIASGAGQWVAGHWVAASALAFWQTLDFLLANCDCDDFPLIAFLLVEYFRLGKTGEVDQS